MDIIQEMKEFGKAIFQVGSDFRIFYYVLGGYYIKKTRSVNNLIKYNL